MSAASPASKPARNPEVILGQIPVLVPVEAEGDAMVWLIERFEDPQGNPSSQPTMKTAIITTLVILYSALFSPSAHADDFPTGTFTPRPGPQRAPLGKVELTQKDGQYLLRFQMAGKWQDVAVSPMKTSDLRGAIGQDPAPVKAHALSSGGVAFILIEPGTKIRGNTISTGIVLISPFFGPGGTAELAKD